MSCYDEFSILSNHAYDRLELDRIVDRYGSEVYICAAVYTDLHGSRFEIMHHLIDRAVERIDWHNPPDPLRHLLHQFDNDDDDIFATGDKNAICELCHSIVRLNNAPHRITLLAAFAYSLKQRESRSGIERRVLEDYMAIMD